MGQALIRRRSLLGAAASGLALAACEAPLSSSAAHIEGGFSGIDVARGHALRDRSLAGGAPEVRRTRVVIAGGGIAGLSAARALRLSGIEDFALLELEDQPGGNSRGTRVKGLPCPMGAHYLPVPGDDASEVQDLLEELGLRQRVAGRWEYDERHLCHSPQERLFFQGQWQEGLLPMQGVVVRTLDQYRAFDKRVDELRQRERFTIPMARSAPGHMQMELDAQTFDAWLQREGLDDEHLRWYLDYCCRDDYGAGIAEVSAWAGIHYFASRHGFHAPGHSADDPDEREGVLTWPEGNGWLSRRLAAPLKPEQLKPGHVVTRIAQTRSGVEVDAFDAQRQVLVRWQAEHCIVAMPVFVAARVVQSPPAFLRVLSAHLQYAPWLVANVHLRAPLADRPGAAPSWDNVLYGTPGLGYVDAGHQRLDPTPRETVITWYRPLGPSRHDAGLDGRRQLLDKPWTYWRDALVSELSPAHPDLPSRATRVEITRYGHAMAMPTPGTLARLWPLSEGGRRAIESGRLSFAHADWSGYSIFEEAFTRGHWAGMSVAGRGAA